MAYCFDIDGQSFLDCIAEDGIAWTRNDIDGPNAGRSIGGTMIRDRVTQKVRLDITCKPLRLSRCRSLLQVISAEFVTAHYIDPMEGEVTKTMYSNNNPVVVSQVFEDEDGDGYDVLFTGITFPLIER